MKNRLHDKKAGIAILLALIIISVAEIVFRIANKSESLLATSNLGEQLAVVILATIILIFTAKGKDRICYLCYSAWIGYFVLDQIFELPSVVLYAIDFASSGLVADALVPCLHVVSMICIIALGILLVEYMNDGSIYNRAFNIFSVGAILSILAYMILNVVNVMNGAPFIAILAATNGLYRLAMVFMFTFFAYDSAKSQLNKVDFSK